MTALLQQLNMSSAYPQLNNRHVTSVTQMKVWNTLTNPQIPYTLFQIIIYELCFYKWTLWYI